MSNFVNHTHAAGHPTLAKVEAVTVEQIIWPIAAGVIVILLCIAHGVLCFCLGMKQKNRTYEEALMRARKKQDIITTNTPSHQHRHENSSNRETRIDIRSLKKMRDHRKPQRKQRPLLPPKRDPYQHQHHHYPNRNEKPPLPSNALFSTTTTLDPLPTSSFPTVLENPNSFHHYRSPAPPLPARPFRPSRRFYDHRERRRRGISSGSDSELDDYSDDSYPYSEEDEEDEEGDEEEEEEDEEEEEEYNELAHHSYLERQDYHNKNTTLIVP